MGSKNFSINWSEVVKLLKNAGFVGAGAGLTYVAVNLHLVTLGPALVALVPLAVGGIQFLITYCSNNIQPLEKKNE